VSWVISCALRCISLHTPSSFFGFLDPSTSNFSFMNIIFDFGGVLINWNPDEIVRAAFEDVEMRLRVKREVFQHDDWLEMDRGGMTEVEAIPRFARRTGLSEEAVEGLLRAADRTLYPRSDTVELLYELHGRGFPIYGLSNIPSERFDVLRGQYEFWELFSGFVISGKIRMVKPRREIYEYLLSAYGLDPARCIFLDDSPKNIEGAAEVGIRGLVFTDAEQCRSELERLLR